MKRRRKSVTPISVREFDALVQETWVLVSLLSGAYRDAHMEQGWPRGGQGVYVSGGDYSDTTAEAVFDPLNRKRRADCLAAIEWLHEAMNAVQNALRVLEGKQVKQRRRVHPLAVLSQDELEGRIRGVPIHRQREHVEREEELRHG